MEVCLLKRGAENESAPQVSLSKTLASRQKV